MYNNKLMSYIMNILMRKIHTCTLTLGCIVLFLLCAYAFNEGKKAFYTKAEVIFEETISKECYNRLGLEYSSTRSLGRKVKRVKITSEKGFEIIELPDSLDEHIANQQVFQHAMLESTPLRPDTLNMLFKQTLKTLGMHTQATGIIYQYKGLKHYSDNDSISMYKAFMTKEFYIDIKKSATVQAWIKCQTTLFIKNIPGWMICIILLYICLLVGLILFWINIKEKSRLRILQERFDEERKTEEAKREHLENILGSSLTMGEMTLYEQSRLVYVSGISCELKKNEFQLLCMFVTSDDHTLCGKEIKKTFWPTHSDATNNLHSLIRQLRTSLMKFPNYRIENLKGMKFKLVKS